MICVITLFILCETPTSIVFFSSVYRTIREQEANDDILETAISEIGQNTSGDHLPPIRVIENLTPNEFDKILYSIALLTAFINFASNFIIYGLVGRRFRRLLHRKLSSWLAALQFCRVCFRCLKDDAYTASYNANSVMRRPSPNKVLTRKKKTVLATKNLVRWQNQTSRLAEELTTLETSKISQTEQLLVEKEVKWELTPAQQPGVSDDVLLSACSKQIKKAKLKWGKAKSGLLQINNDAEETKGNALEFNGKDTEIKENKNAFRNKDSQRFHSNTVVGQIKQIEQKGEGILDSTEIKHAILFEKRTSEHSLGELRNVMQNEEPIRPNKGHDDNQIELENVEMLKIGKGEGTTSKVLLQHYDKNIPEEEEEQLASSNVDTCMNGTVPVPSIEFQKIQSMDPIHLNPNQPLKNTLV
ncbi:unnamed protein product [Protopolystoma xenopodis]|uniref:Uncharacterized protein n=1 Tax=Protopolystoma xenopodis TaxID=117903 RepID=A0A448WMU2_9PLAT|nr:unnamed protein product [Protopolystoma xenopodis]